MASSSRAHTQKFAPSDCCFRLSSGRGRGAFSALDAMLPLLRSSCIFARAPLWEGRHAPPLAVATVFLLATEKKSQCQTQIRPNLQACNAAPPLHQGLSEGLLDCIAAPSRIQDQSRSHSTEAKTQMKHPEPLIHEISHSAPVGYTCRIAMSYMRVTVLVACLVSSPTRFRDQKKTCPSPSPSLLMLQSQSSTSQATGATSKTTPRTITMRMDISGPNKANAMVTQEGQREKKFQPFQPRWTRAGFLMHLTCAASRARPIPIRAGCFNIQADLQNRWTSFGLRRTTNSPSSFQKDVPSHLVLAHRSAKRGSPRPRPPSGRFHP